jgi:hypothetical protein
MLKVNKNLNKKKNQPSVIGLKALDSVAKLMLIKLLRERNTQKPAANARFQAFKRI